MARRPVTFSPEVRAILDKHPELEPLMVKAIEDREREDMMEHFASAQDQGAATAPGRVGQQVAFQPRTMVNQANLAGMGGSLLQMSPPFDHSVRQQLAETVLGNFHHFHLSQTFDLSVNTLYSENAIVGLVMTIVE